MKVILYILAVITVPILFLLAIICMAIAMFISEAPLDYVLDFWKERL